MEISVPAPTHSDPTLAVVTEGIHSPEALAQISMSALQEPRAVPMEPARIGPAPTLVLVSLDINSRVGLALPIQRPFPSSVTLVIV